MYLFDQKPNTNFSEDTVSLFNQLRSTDYSVLVGRNNCGKSFILKTLARQWGASASYLGPQRYHNFNVLGQHAPNKNRRKDWYRNFVTQFDRNDQNIDSSPLNLGQAIADLRDDQRNSLFEIVGSLLGFRMKIQKTIENNEMAQRYVSCEGHNLSFTSSGVRLITTLITSLLDDDSSTFLIDEPELGVSPEAQGILADFLFDRTKRSKYFPHIKTLIFATHSSIFLDRTEITNNYSVEKERDTISVTRVANQAEFNRVHFSLLGNRFETLYLPAAFVIVEGKSDKLFVERVLANKFQTNQISVVSANTDGRIGDILHLTKALLGDFQKSPYRDRVFILLDSVHAGGLALKLESMGVPDKNIIIWSQNGIEHRYPPIILDQIYGPGGSVAISDDNVLRNQLSYKKSELAEKVASLLQPSTVMEDEFESSFLARIGAVLA